MGHVDSITHETFPTQGKRLGSEASLCFHYHTEKRLKAKCIRDDIDAPFRTIFQTEDGKIILADECQYHWVDHD